ncbi:MAG: aspartate--tRNA ligase [bacterium]
MPELDEFHDFARTDYCGEVSLDSLGREVVLLGWVHRRRDHGGVIFVDLRDREGLVQVVFNPQVSPAAHQKADTLRSEFVLGVKGTVRQRPEGMQNPKLKTGMVEVMVSELAIFNRSQVLPFSLEEDTEVDEAIRLRYRYLDLRRAPMQRNFLMRHRAAQITREYFGELRFLEIETPVLTRSTPEGARDYLVPSRVNPGMFYALPQSPQLFKQLLMVAGVDRYFQIARCFRDEDLRADRQPEFTQVDIEMSFIEQKTIIEIMEGWICRLFRELMGIELKTPFPRISYQESMEIYGVDNPDVRYDLRMLDLSDLAGRSGFQIFQSVVERGGVVKAIRLPEGARLTRRELDGLDALTKEWGADGLLWAKCTENGLQSPIAKYLSQELAQKILERTAAAPGDLLLLMAGPRDKVNPLLGRLRIELSRDHVRIDPAEYAFLWVFDFPLFERDKDGRITSKHHPFTAPKPEDLERLEADPESCRSQAYDLVFNGTEVGGGSIRIHQREIQQKVFSVLGLSEAEANEKFEFLLEALSYGAPPHGGIAFGLDRLTMLLAGARSLREVIAFPKTQKATCLLTRSPAFVDPEQLRELHIRTVLPKPSAKG